MKSRQLLSLLLGSTLIFTACGQETKKTEDTKSEERKLKPLLNLNLLKPHLKKNHQRLKMQKH